MTPKQFDLIFNNTIKELKSRTLSKGKEYAPGADRLHNFKRAAALGQTTQEAALLGMLSKHIISIYDGVDALPKRDQPLSWWNEKLGDVIIYSILLLAMAVERKTSDEP